MQFIDVIAKTEQKNLQFHLGFPAEQKSLEFIIVFQYAKGALYLDGTVHAVQTPSITQDVFTGLLATPICTLYPGLSWAFLMWSSFMCMKVASTSVLE